MEHKQYQAPILWDRSSSVQSRLREPKSQSGPAPHVAASQETCLSTPTATHTKALNADAPEFVPTWMKSATNDIEQKLQGVEITVGDGSSQVKHSAQDRLNKVRTPSQPSEHISSAAASNPSEDILVNGYYEGEEGESSADMIRLKQIISSLIMYPGRFDDLLMVFMETIFPYFTDIMAMSAIAELLVSQAINCPNFRYNGVRLCWYLEQKCPAFRAEIHLRCTKELQENLNEQNVVLFIAELYTQLPHDSLYGSLLIESLKKLLISKGNDRVKCVCQALKLTGYSLEESHKAALNDLFSQLKDCKHLLSDSALALLNSVINLRESNWGRTNVESSNSNSDLSDFDHQEYENMVNGIVYETDGEALTYEEKAFLINNATHDELITDDEDDDEDPDALCNPEPEMDEEIQAAFEEFIKLSKG